MFVGDALVGGEGVGLRSGGKFLWVVDESLFSSIPLAFVYPLDSCSVLNCSSLECFSSVGLYWATF